MAILRNKVIKDAVAMTDESNPATSPYDIVWVRSTLDAVFDDRDANEKTLRQILAELRDLINNGGVPQINFPVTSVNNYTGDVYLRKIDLELENVDNTADMVKPLSVPQRVEVQAMLDNYNWIGPDITPFENHLVDYNNPHRVTLDQLNDDGKVDDKINDFINNHNVDINSHPYILSWLERLDEKVSLLELNTNEFNNLLNTYNSRFEDHLADRDAHGFLHKWDELNRKEDTLYRVHSFSKTDNYSETKYGSTKGIVDYVESYLQSFLTKYTDEHPYVKFLGIWETEADLPLASVATYKHAYLLRHYRSNGTGSGNYSALAVCNREDENTYKWVIEPFILSQYNATDFDTTQTGGLKFIGTGGGGGGGGTVDPNGISNIEFFPTEQPDGQRVDKQVEDGIKPPNISAWTSAYVDANLVVKKDPSKGYIDWMYKVIAIDGSGAISYNAGQEYYMNFDIRPGIRYRITRNNGSVTEEEVQVGNAGLLSIMNGITNDINIQSWMIDTIHIAPSAITSNQLATGSVTEGKIGENAVTKVNVADGTIDANKIELNSLAPNCWQTLLVSDVSDDTSNDQLLMGRLSIGEGTMEYIKLPDLATAIKPQLELGTQVKYTLTGNVLEINTV